MDNNNLTYQPINTDTEVQAPPVEVPKKKFFSSKIIFIFLAVVILLGLIFFSYRFLKTKKQSPEWQSIKVGVTDKKSVVKILGQPLKEEKALFGDSFFYASDNQVLTNTLVFDQKDKVTDILEQVPADEPVKYSDWIKKYSQPEKELFNYYSEFTKTYIFPKEGVAVVANKDFDQIYSIHYFAPTDINTYLAKWGSYLSETNPYLAK